MTRVSSWRLALIAGATFAISELHNAAPSRADDAPHISAALVSALKAADTSDYARAERELAGITGADAERAKLALGRVYYVEGKFKEAEKVARACAFPEATALRAQIAFSTGHAADALRLLDPLKNATGAAGRRVRLLLGEYRIATGHRTDAEPPLMEIIDEYNNSTISSSDAEGLAIVGRAAHLLRSPKDANTAFNESERADAKRVETLLWRAELFLEKYDPGHAEETTKEALAVAPNNPRALVLLARVKLDESLDFDAAEALVEEALHINPNFTPAFAVRAGLALRDFDLAAADAAIDAGLKINPNDLELLSLRAASRFFADDRKGYEAAKRETLARNGEYARFFEIVGEFAEWEHRYDDIVAMMKEATQLDPDDGRAWAELGLTEMRSGDETAGLAAIKKAWSKDHFNVRVYNTLNLYENEIANNYDSSQLGIFTVRYPKDEKAVLERYVPRLLSEAWGSMKARYGFVPTSPVQIELYSTREQFSVRTSGLPNIGIQGVCFGRVIASMSPKSEPFNWGNVVWHELGHVFAIQLSKSHVPRWFTEGLSEYETIARRSEWQRELDPELYAALVRGTLPSAVDMNRAFTHAGSDDDVSVAYYAASQMLVFTVEKIGMSHVVDALKLWGQGLRTPEVIERAFGMSASQYDAKYREWELRKLSRYKNQFIFTDRAKSEKDAQALVQAAPNDADAHAALALALIHARKVPQAKEEIDRALHIDPAHKKAHYIASQLAVLEHDVDARAAHLLAIKGAGGDGYEIEMGLADVASARKDKIAYRTALEAASHFDPTQSEPMRALFQLATDEKRDDDALMELRRLAPIEQHDRRVWRTLLDRLVSAGRWDEALRVGESAMYVDVEDASTHTNYARALAHIGSHDRAIYELQSALLCDPADKDAAIIHALFAESLAAKHDIAEARRHLAEAARLDPECPEIHNVRVPAP